MESVMENHLDSIFFPQASQTEKIEGSGSFVEALKLNRLVDSHLNEDVFFEMLNMYQNAFEDGSIAAGVNLMRIMMKVLVKTLKDEDSSKRDMLIDKFSDVTDYLTSIGHPIIPYYEALTHILRNENKEEGWNMMVDLAGEGNKYAITLCAWMVNQEEE